MDDITKLKNVLQLYKNRKTSLEGGKSSKRAHEDESPANKLDAIKECWNINQRCRSLMLASEANLLDLLEACLKELTYVRDEIDAIKSGKVDGPKFVKVHSLCGTPYFRDDSGFPASLNQDVALRQAFGFISLSRTPFLHPWTEDQKNIVIDCIKKAEVERWAKIAVRAGTKDICDYNTKSLATLVGMRKDEYDWMKISVVDLKSARSPLECRAVWFNYLHPAINKTRWTRREDTLLVQLIEKHGCQDWDAIAEELNTGRSAYQCIAHYSTRLRDLTAVPWTDEENKTIIKCVEQFSIGNHIPWTKVAWYLDGRSQNEIYRHWEYINPEAKKGRYSLEEDIILAACVRFFGNDYCRIAEYLPNRTNVQVRSRLQVLMTNSNALSPWTADEDMLLCELVEKYGYGCWSKISQHFINRSNSTVRSRYKSILNWKEKHGVDSMPLGARVGICYNGDLNSLWETAKKIVEERGYGDLEDFDHNPNVRMVNELTRVLLNKGRRGRKPGNKTVSDLDKEYFKFFSCTYVQRGGKGKNIISKEILPTVTKDFIITLRLLHATVQLPSSEEVVDNDPVLPEVDKTVLKHLISQKDMLGYLFKPSIPTPLKLDGKQFCCPPNYSTIVGLRTMLLKHNALKEQARGITANSYEPSPSQIDEVSQGIYKPSTSTYRPYGTRANSQPPSLIDEASEAKFLEARKLWEYRLQFVFLWAARVSKKGPIDSFQHAPEEPFKFFNYGLKEEIPHERFKKKKKIPSKTSDTPKRTYNKSGKFKRTVDPNIPKRTTRHSKDSKSEV